MEVKKELADKIGPESILEYYQDWNSDLAPIMMSFDISDAYPGEIGLFYLFHGACCSEMCNIYFTEPMAKQFTIFVIYQQNNTG